MKVLPLHAAIFFIMGIIFCSTPALAQETQTDEKNAKATAKENWPVHLRFLTGPNGGQWFTMGDPIAEVLTKNVLPTSSRMGGGVANIDAINRKLGDLGFSLSCFLGPAAAEEEESKFIKTDNTVLMANIYPQVLYFLVRKDFAQKHEIIDVGTLLSKKIPIRFASLKPGTASEFILRLLLKYGYDTDFAKLRAQGWKLEFNNYAETADNFVAGELDCFAYTAGTEVPLILTMEEHTEVIILPVKEKVLDLLSEKIGTYVYTIKPGIYKNITEPIKTLGDYTNIIIRKDLPEDLVFQINKALWENKKAISNVVKDFDGLSPETALPKSLPVHPGSVKFWNSLNKAQ